MNRRRVSPSPIDNNCIVIYSSKGSPTLCISSDYMSISKETWDFLHSIYGGGPEVVNRQNGKINVSSTRKCFLSPRLKRISENSISEENTGKSGAISRGKTRRMCEHYFESEENEDNNQEIDDEEDKIKGILD